MKTKIQNRRASNLLAGIAIPTVAVATLALVGCSRKSEPGGPGAVRFAGEQPGGATAEDIFHLVVPTMPVKVRQGRDTDFNIGIQRGPTFDQDVLLKFADLPKGVTAAPAEPTIRRGNSITNVRISASKDSALGTTTVKVFGNPYQGPEARSEFKLSIEK
jgi:hypothetical protein